MLRRLTIRDFVIVDHLELEFREGFGALTGETGAGKSILLDAIGQALGDRGEALMVREGRPRADITLEFEIAPDSGLHAWLEAADLAGDDDTLLVRRVIDANGRSRGWINGVPVALAQLREAGQWLADIHGQHAHHALLRSDAQRALLDARAGCTALASEVAECFRAWQHALRRVKEAERDVESMEQERALLDWQLGELERLALGADEWVALNAEQRKLSHAANLIEGCEAAIELLAGGAEGAEGDIAVLPMLGQLNARLDDMSAVDAELGEARDLIASAAIQADEALHVLRRYSERVELDPARLAEVDQRLGTVLDLARKHHVAPETLPELETQWRARLEELESAADPTRLAAEATALRAQYDDAAQRLADARAPVAQRLGAEITDAMQGLALQGGRFEVVLQAREEPAAHGLEDVEFRVAANAGQPPRPLARVASGGELSRIGLAIQVITSRDATIPTLLFDEVDVGIGGGVAERVGKLLRRLGSERQVMCVTHLPQVAACANWQWRISKSGTADGVTSAVTVLDENGRVEEIARMLGGIEVTETSRRHAAELLAQF